MRERENISHDFFSLAMGPSLDVRSYSGCIVRGVRFHTVEYDFRCTTQNSRVMVIGESSGSGSGDNNFYSVLDEVLDVQYLMEQRVWLFKCTMSSFLSGFEEIDALFFKFDDAFNNMGGSSFVGDTLASRVEKPISLHVVLFNNTIGVCMRDTFLVCYLKWANVPPEYIEVVNQNTLRWSRTLYRVDCHKHFKKYRDPKQTRANSTHRLVGRLEDWYFLCNHYLSRAFQLEFAKQRGQPIDCVELFRETHARNDQFILQATANVYKQMLELQSQPTLKGSQPLFRDEICKIVLGRRSDHSKGLGWRPKPSQEECYQFFDLMFARNAL
ncbi:CACTA en-spm transposon protein [Cucumis melo var. makuwa]|uniref:CACTA en-spm transposon protein n=1 Tax=Cucumis melo var. makuwa TaxID=1194695 RepID=A0A5A7U329_CUCMM|nr:CACTA en-spm transposon protein [Cucumis melo var. makuwa]